MEKEFNFRTMEFIAPSGFKYTIREQNGEDEDILTNPRDAKDLTNLIKFVASLVVDTNYTKSGKLTLEDARNLPLLDKYCIILQNNIFSLEGKIEFDYTFKDGSTFTFEQDIRELVFDDYSHLPSDEELEAKPYALPYYPGIPNGDHSKLTDIEFTLSTGKVLSFDLMTSKSEQYLLGLPEAKRTRNTELIARNLKLQVNGTFEGVTNFKMFSVKEMREIRSYIMEMDPVFPGTIVLENPQDPTDKETYSVLGNPDFFGLMS